MPAVFADTSAIYSYINADELNHAVAASLWRRIVSSEDRIITTNYVLAETVALLQNRLGLEAVREFLRDMAPLMEVHWITPSEHQAALEVLVAANRRKLSFVDCASFVVMRALGIRQAFHFDGHFDEQGFAPPAA